MSLCDPGAEINEWECSNIPGPARLAPDTGPAQFNNEGSCFKYYVQYALDAFELWSRKLREETKDKFNHSNKIVFKKAARGWRLARDKEKMVSACRE